MINFLKYIFNYHDLKKKIVFYNFRKNNFVWLIDSKTGDRKLLKNNGQIEGLEILFPNGEGNVVEIITPYKFYKSQIRLTGSNGRITINQNCAMYNQFINIGDNGKCEIGKNFYSTQDGRFYVGNSSLYIGNDCLFSRRICIYCNDGHSIIDEQSGSSLNCKKDGVCVGNNVWIGDSCHLLKGAKIPNNTVIGACTFVSKEFVNQNTLIYGLPAKVQKSNIKWEM